MLRRLIIPRGKTSFPYIQQNFAPAFLSAAGIPSWQVACIPVGKLTFPFGILIVSMESEAVIPTTTLAYREE
jgi:hypothetical protein